MQNHGGHGPVLSSATHTHTNINNFHSHVFLDLGLHPSPKGQTHICILDFQLSYNAQFLRNQKGGMLWGDDDSDT